ncbi:rust resistance kinase Lr10-like [Daucus carota subsp. sativus]|uniref:rust resistance kinase Lr10-like n=1 Tax=Daucus carota subsp. sativus TaxID=79200 RepID=UPI0007EFE335|nr:PREDICTED: rust resistance kinase Lr10-like [Daucus carota subsp. sativus]
MPNGSLEKFIHGTTPSLKGQNLSWEKLYSIALGIARGLEYLHCGCTAQILHFDIKPHNILLDQDFSPKISDFGLAKIYGMMTLEMVGGRKNVDARAAHSSEIYFPRWAYKHIHDNEDTTSTADNITEEDNITEDENHVARRMMIVGLWCIQANPSQRPSISKVIEMFEVDLATLEIPAKPYLCSAPTSPRHSQQKALSGSSSLSESTETSSN